MIFFSFLFFYSQLNIKNENFKKKNHFFFKFLVRLLKRNILILFQNNITSKFNCIPVYTNVDLPKTPLIRMDNSSTASLALGGRHSLGALMRTVSFDGAICRCQRRHTQHNQSAKCARTTASRSSSRT